MYILRKFICIYERYICSVYGRACMILLLYSRVTTKCTLPTPAPRYVRLLPCGWLWRDPVRFVHVWVVWSVADAFQNEGGHKDSDSSSKPGSSSSSSTSSKKRRMGGDGGRPGVAARSREFRMVGRESRPCNPFFFSVCPLRQGGG